MISIGQSIREIEQREHQERVFRGCYASAIESVREYAVEIEPDLAALFRQHMAALERDLEAARLADDYQALQSSFRGELRDYRDRCREMVTRLRTEVSSAAMAIQTLTQSVSTNGAGYEADLHREVTRLEEAALLNDLGSIRTAINTSAAAIQQSFEQLQQRNRMVMAQLQDEIRSLHKAMENERRTLHTDPASGAWNQRKLAERFDQLLKLDESFGVLLLAVVNWRRVSREYSSQAAAACLKQLVTQLQSKFGADGVVGRWSEDVLAVIVETDPAAAAEAVRGVIEELADGYPPESERQAGLVLRIKAVVVGRKCGANAAEFYPRLGQHVAVLTA